MRTHACRSCLVCAIIEIAHICCAGGEIDLLLSRDERKLKPLALLLMIPILLPLSFDIEHSLPLLISCPLILRLLFLISCLLIPPLY